MPPPASLANLIPYKPGQNGNPKPGNSLKASLMNAMLVPLKEPSSDAPARDHIVYATLKGAINCEPSSAHLREVWDRVEGPLANKVIPPDVNVVFVIGRGYSDALQSVSSPLKEISNTELNTEMEE